MAEPNQNEEVQGIALASFTLSVNLLRYLRDEEIISDQAAQAILETSIQALEKDDRISVASVHAARSVLQSFAEALGLKSLRQN